QDTNVPLPRRRGHRTAATAAGEPLIEAGPPLARVVLGPEARGLLQQSLTLLRVEPGVEVLVGIEPDHRRPVLLHPGDWRLEPVTGEARKGRFDGGDAALPILV